jgi:hypothetical protein
LVDVFYNIGSFGWEVRSYGSRNICFPRGVDEMCGLHGWEGADSCTSVLCLWFSRIQSF